jgi:hypothetical protein
MKDLVAKIKFSEEKISEAKAVIETATPNSNCLKKAKATIVKHEKLLSKYNKLNKKAMLFS